MSSPGCPGTSYVEQAGLKLEDSPTATSIGIKKVGHHNWLNNNLKLKTPFLLLIIVASTSAEPTSFILYFEVGSPVAQSSLELLPLLGSHPWDHIPGTEIIAMCHLRLLFTFLMNKASDLHSSLSPVFTTENSVCLIFMVTVVRAHVLFFLQIAPNFAVFFSLLPFIKGHGEEAELSASTFISSY